VLLKVRAHIFRTRPDIYFPTDDDGALDMLDGDVTFLGANLGYMANIASVVWLDVILSGDNALVIGVAAASAPAQWRRKVILFGLALATVFRISFAAIATYLLHVPGLLVAGGLALLWVSWGLYKEFREMVAKGPLDPEGPDASGSGMEENTGSVIKALVAILLADLSMSVDNIIAVAAIARENMEILIFGLILSIALMGVCATIVLKLLLRYPWISYFGVALLVYIGGHMIWEGWNPLAGLITHHTGIALPLN